jgi:predicted transcriptional regulator
MTVEEELKKLIINKYNSLANFSRKFDFPWSTINGILTRGVNNSSVTTIIKLCRALNLDLEKLTRGIIAEKEIDPKNVSDDYMLIACHHNTGKLTEEEKEEIKQFAEFVKNRRK